MLSLLLEFWFDNLCYKNISRIYRRQSLNDDYLIWSWIDLTSLIWFDLGRPMTIRSFRGTSCPSLPRRATASPCESRLATAPPNRTYNPHTPPQQRTRTTQLTTQQITLPNRRYIPFEIKFHFNYYIDIIIIIIIIMYVSLNESSEWNTRREGER